MGLATLTLITDAAVERPVLCVIDDAQWLDRVSTEVLGFVARRLYADRVGMLFAVRAGEERTVVLEGLSELTVGALEKEAAGELLAASAARPVDQRVGERIVAETAGNPLALVEFAGELTDEELSGALPLTRPLRFGGRLEELYLSRVRALPREAQMLLLLAAADQLGEPGQIWKAAEQLALDPVVAELPAVDRLVSWAPLVQFRHPLMRSAAYYAASAAARRRAHEALAAASDPERDPDRRAWHLAEASSSPDEQVAAELDRSADRARRRGGWASGAAFLERAAELTPGPGRRAQRMLQAAEVLQTVRSAPTSGDTQATLADLLLDGFAAVGEHRYEAGVALLSRAIAPLAGGQPLPAEAEQRFMALSMAASVLYDDSAWHELEHRWVAELRARGALMALQVALAFLTFYQMGEGRLADAEVTLAEGRALCEATGFRSYLGVFACAELTVLALRGREANARILAARLQRDLAGQDSRIGVRLVHYAMTYLELGLGNYQAAFSPLALAIGTHWGLGWLARCRALLAGDDHAESEYRLAIEHLQQCRLVPKLARTHLVYGEWLRRQRRRRDARDQLRTACQMFDSLGMGAFADRARAELRATGEHARKRSVDTQDVLTPQEAQIAGLVSEGLSNQEIAARLFISASTVDYHLRKVFRKLGVTSRVQLARVFAKPEEA